MCTSNLLLELWKPCGLQYMKRSSKSQRNDTRSYAVDCDDVDNDADVEVADVDADDVIADDVDSGLQGTDTHAAICC